MASEIPLTSLLEQPDACRGEGRSVRTPVVQTVCDLTRRRGFWVVLTLVYTLLLISIGICVELLYSDHSYGIAKVSSIVHAQLRDTKAQLYAMVCMVPAVISMAVILAAEGWSKLPTAFRGNVVQPWLSSNDGFAREVGMYKLIFWMVLLFFPAFAYGVIQSSVFSSVSCGAPLSTSYAAVKCFFVLLLVIMYCTVVYPARLTTGCGVNVKSFVFCHIMATNIVVSVRTMAEMTPYFQASSFNELCPSYPMAAKSSSCTCSVDSGTNYRVIGAYQSVWMCLPTISNALYFFLGACIMVEWWTVLLLAKHQTLEEVPSPNDVLLSVRDFVRHGLMTPTSYFGAIFTIIVTFFVTVALPTAAVETCLAFIICSELLVIFLTLRTYKRLGQHVYRTESNGLLVVFLFILLLGPACRAIFETIVIVWSLTHPEDDRLPKRTRALIVTLIIEGFVGLLQAVSQTCLVVRALRREGKSATGRWDISHILVLTPLLFGFNLGMSMMDTTIVLAPLLPTTTMFGPYGKIYINVIETSWMNWLCLLTISLLWAFRIISITSLVVLLGIHSHFVSNNLFIRLYESSAETIPLECEAEREAERNDMET